MSFIEYLKNARTVAATAVLGTTPAIKRTGISMALKVPAPTGTQTFTFYGCETEDGTYVKIRRRQNADTDWTAWEDATMGGITATDAGIYRIPDECMDVPFLKIVAAEAASLVVFDLGDGRYNDET